MLCNCSQVTVPLLLSFDNHCCCYQSHPNFDTVHLIVWFPTISAKLSRWTTIILVFKFGTSTFLTRRVRVTVYGDHNLHHRLPHWNCDVTALYYLWCCHSAWFIISHALWLRLLSVLLLCVLFSTGPSRLSVIFHQTSHHCWSNGFLPQCDAYRFTYQALRCIYWSFNLRGDYLNYFKMQFESPTAVCSSRLFSLLSALPIVFEEATAHLGRELLCWNRVLRTMHIELLICWACYWCL